MATGLKYDTGKAPLYRGLIQYFPRALKAVAVISGYGFEKYKAWGGWVGVPDALPRYSDALLRHIIDECIDGTNDTESELAHAAHSAWNALATLELKLREQEQQK